MSAPTQPVAVRLAPHEFEKLDRVVELLAARNPDLRPTRSDALRYLVSASGSVVGKAVVGISAPPLPTFDPNLINHDDRAA